MKRHRSLCQALIILVWAAYCLLGADGAASHNGETGTQPKAGLEAQVEHLKAQIELQQKQLDAMRVTLQEQQKLLEELRPKPASLGEVASAVPMVPTGPETASARPAALYPPEPAPQQVAPPKPAPAKPEQVDYPLQFHIGDATIMPVGFMDFTNTFRSTNSGATLATNFGSIPYNNTVGGRLTENKMSIQNSRIGFRVDANVHDWHVIGYFEGDFVGGIGNAAFNTQVTSNSVIFRDRLYWAQLRNGPVEVLAGQSWSMMTPNRNHISPLPADLFYGQQYDVNYLNGLTWGRIPGIRFVYHHPSDKFTAGIALENSTQYFGGSGGEGLPTLPSALSNLTSTELDANVVNGIALPNVHPDIIAKIAWDPSSRGHLEIAGVESTFKTFNPNTQQYFTKAGGGGSINGNLEVVRGVRLFTNNFWSAGDGRYMFGLAPDFIVRADGSISLVHSGSTVDGVEATVKNNVFFVYYGGVYVKKNTARDLNGSLIGYGFAGSPNSENRTTQEATAGVVQTIWRNPRFGAVQMFWQYAYFFRNPWSVAPGAPRNAHQSAVWFDLRYTLPGSAPPITR